MSEYLNKIISNRNQNCNMQIVFVDIVKYSERTTLKQVELINQFTKIIESSIEETAKNNYGSLIKNDVILSRDLVLLPTGDGIAIGIPFNWIKDLHLQLALQILKAINANNETNVCQHFNSLNWCNCHNNFSVRIGVSQGTLILYKDINDSYNIAGSEINMAARVMNKGGFNQIVFTDKAHNDYINFSQVEERLKFRRYSNIEIKHKFKIDIYQYFDSKINYLNSEIIEDHKDSAEEEIILNIVNEEDHVSNFVTPLLDQFPFIIFELDDESELDYRVSVSQYLVTQQLYELIIGENPSSFTDPSKPVDSINWFQAIQFCNKLSEKMGLSPLYKIEPNNHITIDENISGFRLPTKKEYDILIKKAFNQDDELIEYAVFGEQETKVVGSKKVDRLGCFDLLGNVWEWCSDTRISNDLDIRIVNGGSYSNFKSQLTKDFSQQRDYLIKEDNIGFRIIKQEI